MQDLMVYWLFLLDVWEFSFSLAWLYPLKKLAERLGNTKGPALAEVQTGSFASLNFDFHNIE